MPHKPSMSLSMPEYTPELEYSLDLDAEASAPSTPQLGGDAPPPRARNWRPAGHEREQQARSTAYDSDGNLKVAMRGRRAAERDCGIWCVSFLLLSLSSCGDSGVAVNKLSADPPIQKVHQIRFAKSVHAVAVGTWAKELISTIVRSHLLDWYAGVPNPNSWTRGNEDAITEPAARQTLRDAFTAYETTLTADPDSPKVLLDRLRAIMHGLETLHANPDPDPELAAVTEDTDGPGAMQAAAEGISSRDEIAVGVVPSP
ncbi:hypothetical protein DFH06DRAFT_1472444 [Mycena polygramma]|nr:hypothetical protein DFH06DRAFT_1472444 [Mycena polygramma]